MSWTPEQYEAYQRRSAYSEARASRARTVHAREHPVIQEQQNDGQREIDNIPQKSKVDGQVCGRFNVSIVFMVSDERDRDGDGMYSTVQDCLISAIGRLVKVDRLTLRKLAKSHERSGRI